MSAKLIVLKLMTEAGYPTFQPSDRLRELGMDSLELVEMLIQIESELGVDINERELYGVTTVQDLIQLVERHGESSVTSPAPEEIQGDGGSAGADQEDPWPFGDW